jgi:Core-2/I-Branching enzyme
MKIAYLILAHHQSNLLSRIVNRLNQPSVHFFIHIDQKSQFIDVIKKELLHYENVKIISNYEINWGGFSIVRAELDLIRQALETNIDFKYFVLLSGQDYPIKSNSFINDFFKNHHEDFIAYSPIRYMNETFKNKHKYYFLRDTPLVNPKNPNRNKLLTYLYFGLHNRFAKYFPTRKFYKNMELYFGSQWFALTYDTIKYVIEYINNNPGFIKSMDFTETPDETFFQTLILNSERRTNLYDYNLFEAWMKNEKKQGNFIPRYSSLRYMDWSEHLKVKPATLDLSYFKELESSDDLFARKIDEFISAELLNTIDTGLLSK